ncbi:hypothetical protein Pmani_027923 [Petrolisthes manimaculis]|uniref:Uncharacterized protein n=1 Tax=Petrolisthes manimaculis TaxID=1843537 RepID=A0AAE1P220_9EUCA|nr:hypothetical protein Pmani_027923 [Petrolisthes manimaculis]
MNVLCRTLVYPETCEETYEAVFACNGRVYTITGVGSRKHSVATHNSQSSTLVDVQRQICVRKERRGIWIATDAAVQTDVLYVLKWFVNDLWSSSCLCHPTVPPSSNTQHQWSGLMTKEA